MCIITIAELYDGAFTSSNPQARLIDMRHFIGEYRQLPFDDAVAETFAEVRSTLRRRGTPISDFDLVIGATALVHDLTVLTFNTRHFERIPDIELYQIGG